jgi:hypothetical protein
MLRVATLAPAALHESVRGNLERGLVHNPFHFRPPPRRKRGRIHRQPLRSETAFHVIHVEQLAGEAPQIVQRTLRSLVALRCSVTELQHPVGGVSSVISRFLVRLGGNARQIGMRAMLQLVEDERGMDRYQALPYHSEGEIALRKFHDERIPVVDRLAEVRQSVLVTPLPFHLAGQVEEVVGLADEVERDVGERDVFLENGGMSTPFGEPVAEDEAVVTQPQEVLEEVGACLVTQNTRTPVGTL